MLFGITKNILTRIQIRTIINKRFNMVLKQVYDDTNFTEIRLPTTCKPSCYSVTLEPDLKAFTFKGQVGIDVEVTQSLDQIVLNAAALNFRSASYVASGETFEVSQVISSDQTETAVLKFDKPLKAGTGKLNIAFDGTLNDKMKGFYRSKYVTTEGEERYAAVTQFEPTDARRAFPCWDEPAAKAKFDITLVVDVDRVALSNMNVIEEKTNDDGKKVVKFATTPIMSTYLVACVVGEFDHVEGVCKNRPVKVFTQLAKKELGQFALDVAIKSILYYEQYFEVPYPLPKMDLIAIPDFSAGAMENWGLVTYRETCLLVDPKNTSTQAKQYIALVVAHEIAHQWFGNLVTMEWWTHLWLNEGFASFMEFLCVDHVFPEYDIWTQFVTDSYSKALELDALHNSHPIEVPVNHPSEIDAIFDDISYNKGASVIRMLHNYISDECFRSGMKAYLTKFAYSNASTEDLWEALEAASSKPVSKVMSQWTKQKGFPWLSVTCKTEGTSTVVKVNQNKFASDGKITPEESNLTWMIPLAVTTGASPSETAKEILLEKASDEIKLEDVDDNWVKFNPGTIGLYRTAYPEEMMTKLRPAISKKTLPPLDRFGIQSDFFALCQAGNVSTVELLKLLNAFSGENNYTVWSSIDNCLSRLNILFSHTDYQELFHSYGRKLYNEIFQKLTWTPPQNESHTDALTRALVIGRLVSFGDQAVIAKAKKLFADHLSKTSLIPADLRSAVYRAVAAYGDDEMFESIFKIYRESDLHEEKNRAARALGYSKDKARIKRVIDFAMSNEVRDQDKVFVIISVAMTTEGRDAAWDLFRTRTNDLKERYSGGWLMLRLIKYSTENFASEEKALEVLKFFTDNQFPGADRTVQQSVETIRLNADWLKRDSSTTKSYLSSSS